MTDRINVKVEAFESIKSAIKQFGDYIKAETLALTLVTDSSIGTKVDWMDGEEIGISIER